MTLRRASACAAFVLLCAIVVWDVAASASSDLPPRATDTSDASGPLAAAVGEPTPAAGQGQDKAASDSPRLDYIVVTPVPTPVDVFAAATQAIALATQDALLGTRTPTPPNVVTATPTPRPYVIINTATPANGATATLLAQYATAVAVATGTPTPYPENAVTATPRPTATPLPRTWPTATPVLIPVGDAERMDQYVWTAPTAAPTPTALPAEIIGKIAFKSDRSGTTRVYVMDPDGGNVALLTNDWAYETTERQKASSSDGRYVVYQASGPHGLDLYVRFLADDWPDLDVTRIGQGVAYDATWSPENYHLAFTCNQDGNDEIYSVTRDGTDLQRLTRNEWEWDKHPTYSPDGTQIAYWSSAGTGRRQIWIMDAGGANARNISSNPYNDWDPVWLVGLR